jgi:MSHA biogenesis protein MshL
MLPGGAGALGGISSDASQMATVQLTDFWAELSVSLRSLVGSAEGRNIVISPQSGLVVVRAMPHELRSVETFLKAMQASVERQVMLEAKIIDVTLSDSYQAGVNWAAFPTSGISGGFTNIDGTNAALATTGPLLGGNFGANPGSRTAAAFAAGAATAGNPAGVFGLALQTSNFAALLQFLESQGTVQVLSSPRVATLNNQKAVLKVGIDEPFATPSSNSQAAGGTQTQSSSISISSVFSGISLDILPQIDDSGNITLHVHPVVSQVERTLIPNGTGTGTIQVPKVNISESDTVVRTTGGNIVALGGLMRVELSDNRGGVPGLSEQPVIGGAFRNVGRGNVKRELVILIKPTVIQSDSDSSEEIRQARDRIFDLMPSRPGG